MNPRERNTPSNAPTTEYADLVRGGDCLASCTADELEDEPGTEPTWARMTGRPRSKNRARSLARARRK